MDAGYHIISFSLCFRQNLNYSESIKQGGLLFYPWQNHFELVKKHQLSLFDLDFGLCELFIQAKDLQLLFRIYLLPELCFEKATYNKSYSFDPLFLYFIILVNAKGDQEASDEIPVSSRQSQIVFDDDYKSLNEKIYHFMRSFERILVVLISLRFLFGLLDISNQTADALN